MLTKILESTAEFKPQLVAEWLVSKASRSASTEDLVVGLAEALGDAGLPIDRLTVGIPILLPHISGMQFRWYRGSPISQQIFPATDTTLRRMEDSPIRAAYSEGRMTRCRVDPQPIAGEYPIIADLRGEGFRDYAVFPIPFSDGTFKILTIATRDPGGFDDRHIRDVAALTVPLSPALEIHALRHLARSLLDVYIGPTAGKRVIEGEVRRGDGEMIQAAIWISDLRNSTDMSANMEGPALIALLNDFFGAVTGAVAKHGGEVLKFTGDSVLAIFPCSDRELMGCNATGRAEAAANEAIDRIAALNQAAPETGKRTIDFGIALHFGDVFFGNVGGLDRLDFTVIGQAVNLAARIESLCRETGELLLVSEEFAEMSASTYDPIGSFQFHGIDGWQSVYARQRAPGSAEADSPAASPISGNAAPQQPLKE